MGRSNETDTKRKHFFFFVFFFKLPLLLKKKRNSRQYTEIWVELGEGGI